MAESIVTALKLEKLKPRVKCLTWLWSVTAEPAKKPIQSWNGYLLNVYFGSSIGVTVVNMTEKVPVFPEYTDWWEKWPVNK